MEKFKSFVIYVLSIALAYVSGLFTFLVGMLWVKQEIKDELEKDREDRRRVSYGRPRAD